MDGEDQANPRRNKWFNKWQYAQSQERSGKYKYKQWYRIFYHKNSKIIIKIDNIKKLVIFSVGSGVNFHNLLLASYE